MSKVCPNCQAEYDDSHGFCSSCGSKLVTKSFPQTTVLNIGDANAISGGVHVTDSHNVVNCDNRVINSHVEKKVVNNVTQYASKNEVEILQEKKSLFLAACQEAYKDNILEHSELIALEEYRLSIGLDKVSADSILDSVRQLTIQSSRPTELTGIAKIRLKQFTDLLRNNEVKALMDQVGALESLADKFDNEELHYKYYLVLSALRPEECIKQYENAKVDSYWQYFWTFCNYSAPPSLSWRLC